MALRVPSACLQTTPGSVVQLAGLNNTQMDLHKLEEWSHGNLTRFNKANCKMLLILKYRTAGASLNYFIALTLICNTNFKYYFNFKRTQWLPETPKTNIFYWLHQSTITLQNGECIFCYLSVAKLCPKNIVSCLYISNFICERRNLP